MSPARRPTALVIALLCVALVAPGAGAAASFPAGATSDEIATAAAKKKRKKCRKGTALKTRKVNGKRRKVCVKKKAPVAKPAPPKPAPAPAPAPVPAAPAPAPAPPAPPPVDPEQFRADDLGRQLFTGRDIFLERFTGSGFGGEYTRIYVRSDGRLKIAVSDYNLNMGEKCRTVTEGTWAFNRAYKPPEGGILAILDITYPGGGGTDLFWVVSESTVKVGKDMLDYTVNDSMGEPC